MNIEFLIYLAGVVNRFALVLYFISFSSLIGFIIMFCFEKDNTFKTDKSDLKKIINGIRISTIVFILTTLIPDSNTLYTMAGAHFGREAMQTETAQRVKHLLDLKLDELITEAEKANARTK